MLVISDDKTSIVQVSYLCTSFKIMYTVHNRCHQNFRYLKLQSWISAHFLFPFQKSTAPSHEQIHFSIITYQNWWRMILVCSRVQTLYHPLCLGGNSVCPYYQVDTNEVAQTSVLFPAALLNNRDRSNIPRWFCCGFERL